MCFVSLFACDIEDRLLGFLFNYAVVSGVTSRRLWVIQDMSVTAVDGWCDIYDSVVATNRESRVI